MKMTMKMLTVMIFNTLSPQVAFTRSFSQNYKAIGKSLTKSTKPDLLSNHLVHVSVQLFSCDALATTMVLEEKLLHTLVAVLVDMVGQCLQSYDFESLSECKSKNLSFFSQR